MDLRGILPRQFEYLFNEISKIQTKNRFMRERRNNTGADSRKSVSPGGVKGCSMNYTQFGENIKEISFEIVCSYSEIYNEQIFDLLETNVSN